MQRPRIKRTTEEIETPDGDIILLRPSAGQDIRIEKPDAEERRLLAAVDGERTLEQLRAEFGAEEVDDLIAQMQGFELIEDAADDERIEAADRERFDRQLRYFSDIGTADTPTPSECQERLREAKIAVLGMGGLGGWSALTLACIGIGEMRLIDFDRVEVSNLNRQVLFSEADIGLLKVECAASRLRSFNSGVKITTEARRLESEEDIAEFIAGSDFVIDAADWPFPDIERWCNSACFEAGIPYITMSHFPPVARVGPLYIPGKTGCFTCQEIGHRREYPLYDVAIEQGRAKASPAATLGPACGLIGGHVAMEAMHLLSGLCRPAAQGVAHMYDLRTMEIKREVVTPEPECPICGDMEHEEISESADG
ncbi:MAG TPA: TOMM precursor leader peptide-binding protein [Solirubrobacterales bacterium]|nr:TOMM precursor leader peptide-binding protein [Solirubrobacterales bacterium]